MNYIFDVDGTLTPSRLPIDNEFKTFFLEWMEGKNVYLLTGSDKDKTIEQVGKEIWTKVNRAYQSCGNAVYEKGELIKQSNFKLNFLVESLLAEFLGWSEWSEQYGNHIEERIGLINFSTIGRSCPQEAREAYYKWDLEKKERERICRIIEEKFPELEASVGGEISIDIHPKGKNKSQILKDIKCPITFLGDRCEPGGNDYPIVEKIKDKHTVYNVKNWEHTYEILNKI